MTEQTDSSPPRRIGWKGGVTGLLALGIAFYAISTADGDSPAPPEQTGIERHEAWGACQEAVKKRLDNPATADFAILTTENTERPDGGHDFSGSLTADNTFGVEQELIFSCEVTGDRMVTADVQRAR